MAGYKGYSMSNNAVEAYRYGEKPKSKWTKESILVQMKRDGVPIKKIQEISKMSAADIRDEFLSVSSWHHTSKHYNRTDFYSVDSGKAEEYDMKGYVKFKPIKTEKKKDEGKKAYAEYLVWSGTRNHPKATEVRSEGIVKGDWFYLPYGTKKSIWARGFRILKEGK